MQIPSIGLETRSFKHSVDKTKSREDHLPSTRLDPKDRITISPGAMESFMAEESKRRKSLHPANDDPYRKALIETLALRKEWEAIKTALHRKGDKERDSTFNHRLI